VIPLRPLGLGEILDGSITTMRTYPKATLGFAAVISAISQLLMFFLIDGFIQDATSAAAVGETASIEADLVIFGLMVLLVTAVGGLILSGCLTAVMGQAVLGRPVSLSEAWAKVRPRIWALIGAALLSLLIIVGGTLLLVLPGIYFYVAFSLATPALILENQPVTKALRRSWDLVKGTWWRVFGILLLTNMIAGFVGNILELPFGFAGGAFSQFSDPNETLSTGDLAWQSLAGLISTTVTGPFVAGVTVLLYVDRRMRREGLDVTLAATAAQQAAQQYPTA
jgi:hypothetical protein